ncbi:MAG: metal ABC transporter solute-binding protein, Zn/Mn family [Fusobacteriaceae bacterium]
MKKLLIFIFSIFPILVFGETLTVFTTIHSSYDFIKQVGGDYVHIESMIPSNVESHNYEPTPRDIVKFNQGDLIFYTNKFMEPWIHKLEKNLKKNIKIVDLSRGIDLKNDNDDGHSHGHHYDPHMWLSISNSKKMVENITLTLAENLPAQKEYFEKNRDEYIKKLDELKKEYQENTSFLNGKSLIYIGHNSFSYLARNYNFEIITPYASLSSDAEPTPGNIIKIINHIKENKVNVIYYEAGKNPKNAEIIGKETGVEFIPLNTLHNIPKNPDSNKGYLYYMRDNLEKIKKLEQKL